ncbi:MAG TPA: GNAT family N-acetyltransferase, partial [Solirubrobacteraceae bacterium]|nr:GNAT family N-acetyltransferase [Solirubrobacteraceae bacterium]
TLRVPERLSGGAVAVRRLAGEDPGWAGVLELQEADNLAQERPFLDYRTFAEQRIGEWRSLIGAGRGAWFVVEDAGAVVASLGVIVTDGRARYQAVDVAVSHRRRGIASHLVCAAAEMISAEWPVRQFVIAAVPDDPALGLYEALGFQRAETVHGVFRRPVAGG